MVSEWFFEFAGRKSAIGRALQELSDQCGGEILAQTARGNIVWAVVAKPHSVDLHAIFLVPMDRGAYWKYRFCSERDRFKWVTCPEGFLGQTRKSIQRNELWRKQVREYHQKRRKRLRVGDCLKLVACNVPEVIVIRLNPLIGVYGGKNYKIPRRLIELEGQQAVTWRSNV